VPEFDPGDLPNAAPLAGTPLTRLWRTRPLRGPTAPIARDSQTLYLGGADRRVIAVDLGTGKTRWAHRVAGPLLGGVVADQGVVYAATERPDGKVHAFQTVSGNELWSTGTGYVEAPVALLEDRLIVLNRRGQILALDRSSGRILWRRRLPSQRLGPRLLTSGLVLVTSHDSLYLVRPTDGGVTLRRPTPGAITAPWVPLGSDLVAGTGDSMVVAVSPEDLSTRWSARLDAPVLASPAVLGDTVYAVTLLGTIYRLVPGAALRIESLRAAPWAVTGAPMVFGDWLLVGGSEGALRAFDRANGTDAWSTPLGRPLELAPLVLDRDGFVALGGQGDLHRIRR
jgi:outer membrane protein assembly factor BamB